MTDKNIYKQIARYINGELNDSEIDTLWEEFLRNPEMFEYFETELNLADLFRNKGYGSEISQSNLISEPKYVQYKKWIFASAAAILISLGLQVFSVTDSDLISNYSLSEIPVTEMMGTDIYRAEIDDTNPLDIAINQALAKAFSNKSDESFYKFTELASQDLTDEQKTIVHLNLGILHYNRGEDQKSIEQFLSVLNIEELPRYTEEKAWWFMGNAYLNTQNVKRAREAVFSAYTMNGKFEAPALALLKKIDRKFSNQSAQAQ